MKIDRNEQVKRSVGMLVSSGLAGAGLNRQAKRVERAMGQRPDFVWTLLSTLEQEPEVSARCVRLIALGKKVLKGDESFLEPLRQLSWVMIGVVPEPTEGN